MADRVLFLRGELRRGDRHTARDEDRVVAEPVRAALVPEQVAADQAFAGVLATAGQRSAGVMVILNGNVKVSRKDVSGVEEHIVTYGPGGFLGGLEQLAREGQHGGLHRCHLRRQAQHGARLAADLVHRVGVAEQREHQAVDADRLVLLSQLDASLWVANQDHILAV